MKILMLVPRFPYPPVRGDGVRAWGEAEYLADRHELWLACIDRVPPAPAHLVHVRRRCRDVAVVVRSHAASLASGGLAWLRGRSLTEGYFYDERLARIVQLWDHAIGFDAVFTFSPAMSPYALLTQATRRVLDMNDVESARWRVYAAQGLPPARWLYALEARRLARVEPAWVAGHDVTLLVNACEQDKLPVELRDRSAVVRTGIDPARYDLWPAEKGVNRLPHRPVVGFVGSLSYGPNVRAVEWFGRTVWPAVRAAVPEARWLIVGREPARRVRRWARQPHVTITGFVDDIRPYLARMRVFVCPAREQIGVQTKLIEALASGRAAVVTPQAAAGIDYDDPPPFLVAPSPTEFAEGVVRLLRDEAQALALGARARATAEANYAAEEQQERIERWLVSPESYQLSAFRFQPGICEEWPAALAGSGGSRL
jgi:sugar transferase (PEP-CTERM/EpsH1 system associated)